MGTRHGVTVRTEDDQASLSTQHTWLDGLVRDSRRTMVALESLTVSFDTMLHLSSESRYHSLAHEAVVPYHDS